MKKLLPGEELDIICPNLTEEIGLFVASNPALQGKEEAAVYALCQAAQNIIDKLELEDVDKGAVVSTIIKGMLFFNIEAVTLHNERMRELAEGMSSTKH